MGLAWIWVASLHELLPCLYDLYRIYIYILLLVTTSKALVPSSDALVTNVKMVC